MSAPAHDGISANWANTGLADIYGTIVAALREKSKSLDELTIEDLAPVDHFHARGIAATVELADKLPIQPGQSILDIGCGLGGPARYIANRFKCTVSGIDITDAFVQAANKLTALLRMESSVEIILGDGRRLPYASESFDGAYTQHVTMNVADREGFFAEAHRVLRPGGFFALTEHGRGPGGEPHYPAPWSEDGSGGFLVTAEETEALLAKAGFRDVVIESPAAWYLAGYRKMIEKAENGTLPPFGVHLLMGASALQKMRNTARNIEEGRTHPIQVMCRKPE